MIAVIDTNFLVKYFSRSKDLTSKSIKVFENKKTFLVIPSIVLVELKYIIAKGRIPKSISRSVQKLIEYGNCMVYPLDQDLVDFIPAQLNIHDGIIYATSKLQSKNFTEEICLLSKDQEIAGLSARKLKVLW